MPPPATHATASRTSESGDIFCSAPSSIMVQFEGEKRNTRPRAADGCARYRTDRTYIVVLPPVVPVPPPIEPMLPPFAIKPA